MAVKAPTADASTYVVTWTGNDDLGRATKEIRNCTSSGTTVPSDPAGCTGAGTADAQTNLVTTFTYDAHGNKVSVTAPDPSATTGTSTAVVTTRFAYDGNDRLCRVLENATVDLQTLVDPCSTSISGTATTNVSTRYTYDPAGNLASMVDAASHITVYGHDGNGRMTSLTDADGNTVSWTYDGRGNRLSQTNRVPGSSVTWTFDAANRMMTRAADGATTTYGYDNGGNRTAVTAGTQTISTTHDRLNRPLVVSDSTDPGSTTTYTYSFTAPTRIDPSSATAYSFTVDTFGRETAMVDPIHGAGAPWTTAYRADGQPSSRSAPNGNTTGSTYNLAGLSTGTTTTAPGPVTRASYGYSLNRAGQRLTETSIRGWQVSHWNAGLISTDAGENAFGLSLAWLSVTTRATVSSYGHGSLVTAWDEVDIRRYIASCFGFDLALCPDRVHSKYRLLAGSKLNGVGDQPTSYDVQLWSPGHGGLLGWNPLASPPWDYGHFNVWVPRAWGSAHQVTSRGSVSLEGGAILWSAGLKTTGTPYYYSDDSD